MPDTRQRNTALESVPMCTAACANLFYYRCARKSPTLLGKPGTSGFSAFLEFSVGGTMLRWALIFLVVALLAGVLGFAGIMVAAAGIAKLLFYLFVVLFVISLFMGLLTRA